MVTGWAALIVGHQWPSDAALAAIRAAGAARAATARSFEDYAGRLTGIEHGPLARQEGVTADAARARFRSGADHALGVAERQRTTAMAYDKAQHCVAELRRALTAIAADAQTQIERIAAADAPMAARVSQISSVVRDAQARADSCAATHGGGLLDAIQTVLNGGGTDTSARSFVSSQGLNLTAAYRHPARPLDSAVAELLGDPDAVAAAAAESPNGAAGPGCGAGEEARCRN